MNLPLMVARIYLPAFVKKKKVQELFELTADAFDSPLPAIEHLSYRDCLSAFARFSKTKAEEAIRLPDRGEEVKKRLYKNACRMGEKLRENFKLKTRTEVLRLSKILYRVLGIDFNGDHSGEVKIKHCFFKEFYTADVCRLISALDEGVAAGLSGGGVLRFEERITEGKICCRAIFTMKDTVS